MKKIRSKYTRSGNQFACFRIEGTDFGIPLSSVREIIRYRQPEPCVGLPCFIEGFIQLRSMRVPVVDLRKRFSPGPGLLEPTRIIIASAHGRIIGFLVDEVNDIIVGGKELRLEEGLEREPWHGCIERVFETGKSSVRIIDLSKLFSAEEIEVLSASLGAEGIF